MKILAVSVAVIGAAFGGCTAYAQPGVEVGIDIPLPVIVTGYYDPVNGYWTGSGWDRDYYSEGHRGYGLERYHGSRYGERGHGTGHGQSRGPGHGHSRGSDHHR